jgi:hypothetical protein
MPGVEWLAYGRTADIGNALSRGVTPQVARGFRERWEARVGGFLTAQPLYVPNVHTARGKHSLLIVATGENKVLALDATDGRPVWSRSLGPTVPQVCGGRGGIASTPAIDLRRGLVYVMSAQGTLRALLLPSGEPVPGWSVRVVSRVDVETVWSGLRIHGRQIYVPVASFCDRADRTGRGWDGRLVAVDRLERRVSAVLDVVPGPDNGGSIWGPGGVAVDPRDGSIWTATANATVHEEGQLREQAPLAERVLRLSRSLRVRAQVVQPDHNEVISGDQGFGGTPMLFQPAGCPPLLGINSKSAYTYVWRRDSIARPPLVRTRLGPTASANEPFHGQPTWFRSTRTLVVAGAAFERDSEMRRGVVGLRLGPGCTFSIAWKANIGGGVQPQPLALGTVAFVSATGVGKLVALDSATGEVLTRLDTGGPAFTAPMVAGDVVVVGGSDGTVRAFGSA